MTNKWYYGRGAEISGPVSGRELLDLAANGHVLPTDTIWRDSIEVGVPAASVKNLFPAAPASASASAAEPTAPIPQEDVAAAPTVVADAVPAAPPPFVPPLPAPVQPPRPARATAGAGAVILSQDGKTVKYRGKCTTCGREDTSWKSIAIPRGTARASFFCAKCRKRRDVEIYGIH
jgi:hypothetical protein